MWFINVMKSFAYFNIIFVCVLTLYTLDTGINQAPVINISVGLIIFAVLLYHIFKNTNLFSREKEQEQNNNELELEAPPSPVESIYCEVEIPFKEQQMPSLSQVAMKPKPDSQQQNDDQECGAFGERQRQCSNIILELNLQHLKTVLRVKEPDRRNILMKRSRLIKRVPIYIVELKFLSVSIILE